MCSGGWDLEEEGRGRELKEGEEEIASSTTERSLSSSELSVLFLFLLRAMGRPEETEEVSEEETLLEDGEQMGRASKKDDEPPESASTSSLTLFLFFFFFFGSRGGSSCSWVGSGLDGDVARD